MIAPRHPATVEPLLKAVTNEHSKPDETFLLICDLTTVAQLGDLILAKWKAKDKTVKIVVAELKTGSKNVLLHKRLHDPKVTDLNAEIARIAQELGARVAAQAARMVKQEKRLKNFDQVIATDKGSDPMTGQPFRMVGGGHASKDYRDKLRTLIARAKFHGTSALTLDRCLHFLAFTTGSMDPASEGLQVAHQFYHMRHGDFCRLSGPDPAKADEMAAIINGPMAVNLFDFGMWQAIGMPPLLWYPRDAMLDVLMGRIKVFTQFDHEEFFRLASRFGIKMEFVHGKEAARVRSAKVSGALIEYRDTRFVKAKNVDGRTMGFGAKFFTRVYIDLIRPSDLLMMARELLAAPTKETKT